MSMREYGFIDVPGAGRVRTINERSVLLYAARDVAAAMGYRCSDRAVDRHCMVKYRYNYPTGTGVPEMTFISRLDVSRMGHRSRLPFGAAVCAYLLCSTPHPYRYRNCPES